MNKAVVVVISDTKLLQLAFNLNVVLTGIEVNISVPLQSLATKIFSLANW